MKKKLIFDLCAVFLIIACSFLLIGFFKLRFLTQALVLFLPPSLYLLWRKPKGLSRTLAGTFLIGGLFYFFLVFIGDYNNAWFEPVRALVFPYKILGLVPLDEIGWGLLWTFMIIVSYEHFLERERKTTLSKNFFISLYAILCADIAAISIFLVNPALLKFSYAYSVLCVASLIPIFYTCFKKPELIRKIIRVIPFFAVIFFAYEMIGLAINGWGYTGQYIGMVSFGTFHFPIEEILFWFILSSLIVLVDYELYVDDEK